MSYKEGFVWQYPEAEVNYVGDELCLYDQVTVKTVTVP